MNTDPITNQRFQFSSTKNGDKLQVTLILTVQSDGHKFLPYVILPNDTQNASTSKTFDQKLYLQWSDKLDFDEELLIDYLKRLFDDETTTSKRLFLWNKFGCQLDDELRDFLKQKQIDNTLISFANSAVLQVCFSFYWYSLVVRKR